MSKARIVITQLDIEVEGGNARELLDELLGRFCGALMATSRSARVEVEADRIETAAPAPEVAAPPSKPRRRSRGPVYTAMLDRLLAAMPNVDDWFIPAEELKSTAERQACRKVAESDPRFKFESFGPGVPARIVRVADEAQGVAA